MAEDESNKCQDEFGKGVEKGLRGEGWLEAVLDETIGTIVSGTKEWKSHIAGIHAGRQQQDPQGSKNVSEKHSGGGSSSYQSSNASSPSAGNSFGLLIGGAICAMVLFLMIIGISALRNGQMTLGAANNGMTVDSAKALIPAFLNRLYKNLNEGNPAAAGAMLSSELARDPQKLDYICRPFAYRAHYVEAVVGRTDGDFQARTHVLFKPMEERIYVLHFRIVRGKFILADVSGADGDWLQLKRAIALDLGRKFAYAAKAGRKDILREITTPSLALSKLSDPEYQYRLEKMGEVSQEQVDVKSSHGLKLNVNFYSQRGTLCQDEWSFLVDNVRGEDKIVSWDFKPIVGCYSLFKSYSSTEDPNLDSYTLERFGIKAAATETVEQPVPE